MTVVIRSPTVLLLEHDITIRYPLAEYMRECGYKVFEARAGGDAAKLLDSCTSGLTAAVMNLRSLEEAAALAFAKRIRDEHRDAEIFLVETADAAADRVAGLCHAVDRSLSRQQHKHQLLDHLMQLHAEALLKN